MAHSILLAGAGQLGSRYLQGMAKFPEPLAIWVLDPSEGSLVRARRLWDEIATGCAAHTVDYVRQLDELPTRFDLAVVATTADVRPALVAGIVARAQVANWVLEKVLAQSLDGLDSLSATIGGAAAWVNTPRHLWSLYQRLRTVTGPGPVDARFDGFRGLACNAIHFIDLIARWNGAAVAGVTTRNLDASWVPAKRDGFLEVEGALAVSFTDGSSLHLSSGDGSDYTASLSGNGQCWRIFEDRGYAESTGGQRVEGGAEYQSALTARLIAAIFAGGECGLPTLAQSCEQHTHLLSALLAHWASSGRSGSNLPIT